MPILRRTEPSKSPSPYARLRLTNNPFTADPIIRPRSKDSRTNGSIFADGCRREVISRFEKLLLRGEDFDNRARLALLWSEGDKESGRGTGKTALLRHFQHRINQDWGMTEFGAFNVGVIYVAFPDQVDRLFSEQLAWAALLDAHDSGLLRTGAATLRLRCLEALDKEAATALEARIGQEEEHGRDAADLLFDKELLEQCGVNVSKLEEVTVDRIVDEDVRVDVARALASGDFESYLRALRRDGNVRPYWVTRDTKGLGIARDLLFNDVVKFLELAGFQGAYLFIDDIENLTDQMANREAIEFAKELALGFVRPGRAAGDRRFLTGVITTHQQAATKLARGWGEAGLQGVVRLDPAADTSIKVPLPTEDGALEMLAAYIKEHRSEGEEVAHLHPFTEAAARKLVSSVSPALHPRTFLQKAHFAVRAAVDAEAASIDVADIEALLKETGAGSTNPVDTGEPTNFDVY